MSPSARTVLGAVAGASLLAALCSNVGLTEEDNKQSWEAKRALGSIAAQLRFGSRALSKAGHAAEIHFIEEKLQSYGLTVSEQKWAMDTPLGNISLVNIVGRLNPQASERRLVGTHYDSILRAYRDEKSPDAVMPGANNSASGVAVLLETARVAALQPRVAHVGVDFVFFDGEEGPRALGAGDPQWHALGSPHFVEKIKEYYPNAEPESAVILDMVCFKDSVFHPEIGSKAAFPSIVKEFWSIGKSVNREKFSDAPPYQAISDDQTAFQAVDIPSILLIDINYEPWFNTSKDTIDKCSTDTLQAVGDTVLKYISR